jgi:chloramphenicol 3-O phosphotransferase
VNIDIVLLNGPSSSGKSSISRELQRKLNANGFDSIIISLDDYLKMSVDEPIWEDDVFAIIQKMYEDISQALQLNKKVIVDHVITSERIYEALLKAIAGYNMKRVMVKCSIDILRKREVERANRFIGSAEASLEYLFPKNGYDLIINSEQTSPAKSAELILEKYFKGK